MTQAVYADIDANTKSGTALAVDLNNFKASLLTMHSGASRPSYVEVGLEWLDSSVTNRLTKKIYDGSQDVTIYTLDTAAHIISYGGNNPTAAFSITRTDTAADMLELYRNTQLTANAGIIFTQRNDADVKKTMGNLRINSEAVGNGAEEASFSFLGMKAGVLTELFKITKDLMFADFLVGTGKRYLVTDENGNVSSEPLQSSSNIFSNGDASTADESTYTATGLSFTKSTTASELIFGDTVFKAVSSAASETLVTESIILENGAIDHPMIVSLNYKASQNWTIELLDQADSTLVSETINAFTPVSNEGRDKKLFAVIPNGTTSVKVRMTSTAADTLLFNSLRIYSQSQEDDELYFEKDIANNQSTAATLLDIARLKNKAYKVEARIARETDTNYAEAIVELFISYNQNLSSWRIAKETVSDLESVDTDLAFTMNGNSLEYTSSDITGTNYTGKINGKIKRIL